MAVYLVSNTSELNTALSKAAGGDRIEMKSGSYGDVSIQNRNFASNVVITAHDAGAPPTINSISLWSSSHIKFDGINLKFTPDAQTVEWSSGIRADLSSNISVVNSTITGGDAVAGIDPNSAPGTQGSGGIMGYPIGYGLSFNNCSNISIENNKISEFRKGVNFSNVDGIQFNQNEVWNVRTVPVGGGNVNNVHMEGNYLHDIMPWKLGGLGDHGDFVHFWTNPDQVAPSSHIDILNNNFSQGNGAAVLGIYLDNNANPAGFSDVTIDQNVMYNGNAQGLRLEDVNGVVISHNTFLQVSGEPQDAPRFYIEDGTVNASIYMNIVYGITGAAFSQSVVNNINAHDNAFVQNFDPTADNFYDSLFIASSMEPVNGRYGFVLLPGSAAALMGAGAAATGAPGPDDALAARFHVTSLPGDGATRIFDASFSELGGLPAGSTVSWAFGDGSTAEGVKISHSYSHGGSMDVVLTVTTPDGKTSIAKLDLGVQGPDLVAQTASGGFAVYHDGVAKALALPAAASAEGLQLGASGVAASVSRAYLRDLPVTDEIDISLSLKADAVGASGELFRLHGSFTASVTAAGALMFSVTSNTGVNRTITSSIGGLADGHVHDIGVRIADGSVRIFVDGVAQGVAAFSGPLYWSGYQDLNFGNQWGAKNFNGDLSDFRIITDKTDFPSTPDSVVLQPNPPAAGGMGDDVYVVDSADMQITDPGGIDTVTSSLLSLNLASSHFVGIENARLSGSADLSLSGNAGANLLVGNDGNNTLAGGLGADTLYGSAGNDTLSGGNGGDLLYGGAGDDNLTGGSDGGDTLSGDGGNDTLHGGAGNDTLDGGAGNDMLTGGGGDDVYVIDSAGDKIVEASDGGYDTVVSSFSIILAANVERGILAGDGSLSAKAAALASVSENLTGNARDNVLIGNDGANKINGGLGDDTMRGGAGDDVYVIDSSADRIVEASGDGYDTVLSSISTHLTANVERGILTGSAQTLIGNDGDNLLIGNDGNNTLTGGLGDDTLRGGDGDDAYVIDSNGDLSVESAGNGYDSVLSSISTHLAVNIEKGVLTGAARNLGGNASNNTMIGNNQANVLAGGLGNDSLFGALGRDTLSGGAGNDTLVGGGDVDYFIFRTGGGHDIISDFNATGAAHDVLDLRSLVSVQNFADLQAHHLHQVGQDAVISGGAGDVIVLHNVQVSDLHAQDFLF